MTWGLWITLVQHFCLGGWIICGARGERIVECINFRLHASAKALCLFNVTLSG